MKLQRRKNEKCALLLLFLCVHLVVRMNWIGTTEVERARAKPGKRAIRIGCECAVNLCSWYGSRQNFMCFSFLICGCCHQCRCALLLLASLHERVTYHNANARTNGWISNGSEWKSKRDGGASFDLARTLCSYWWIL